MSTGFNTPLSPSLSSFFPSSSSLLPSSSLLLSSDSPSAFICFTPINETNTTQDTSSSLLLTPSSDHHFDLFASDNLSPRSIKLPYSDNLPSTSDILNSDNDENDDFLFGDFMNGAFPSNNKSNSSSNSNSFQTTTTTTTTTTILPTILPTTLPTTLPTLLTTNTFNTTTTTTTTKSRKNNQQPRADPYKRKNDAASTNSRGQRARLADTNPESLICPNCHSSSSCKTEEKCRKDVHQIINTAIESDSATSIPSTLERITLKFGTLKTYDLARYYCGQTEAETLNWFTIHQLVLAISKSFHYYKQYRDAKKGNNNKNNNNIDNRKAHSFYSSFQDSVFTELLKINPVTPNNQPTSQYFGIFLGYFCPEVRTNNKKGK